MLNDSIAKAKTVLDAAIGQSDDRRALAFQQAQAYAQVAQAELLEQILWHLISNPSSPISVNVPGSITPVPPTSWPPNGTPTYAPNGSPSWYGNVGRNAEHD